MKLLQIVKIKGDKNWKTIAKDFPNRTRSQCRQRFHIIFKSFQKFRNFTLRELHYSDADSRQKKRQDELYRRLYARVSDFLQVHKIKNEAFEEIDEEYYVTVPHLRPSDIHETPDGVSIINLFIYSATYEQKRKRKEKETETEIPYSLQNNSTYFTTQP